MGCWLIETSEIFSDLIEFLDPHDSVVENALRILVLRQAIVKDADVLRDHLSQACFGQIEVHRLADIMQLMRAVETTAAWELPSLQPNANFQFCDVG